MIHFFHSGILLIGLTSLIYAIFIYILFFDDFINLNI